MKIPEPFEESKSLQSTSLHNSSAVRVLHTATAMQRHATPASRLPKGRILDRKPFPDRWAPPRRGTMFA
jgi:hypothetical protein